MPSPQRIWLTRPLDDSLALAETLKSQGVESIIAPVMRITPTALEQIPDQPDALLLTSRHAAHALATLPTAFRTLKVYCVGSTTAEAAEAKGFSETITSEGDMFSMLPLLAQLPAGSKLLYLSGEETRMDVGALLNVHRIHTDRKIVYRADAIERLPENLLQALQTNDITGACFFSPRSAKLACALLNTHRLAECARDMEAYCLSLAVAEAAAVLDWKRLHSCAVPSLEEMQHLIVSRAA